MKAMIFAAGLGTRLRPLTLTKPKALVEVNGKTLLEILIQRLKHAGIQDIIINIHYLADQIIAFLKEHKNFGVRIAFSDETSQLLDTGGGLKKAGSFFDGGDPFLLYNVDILSNIDIKDMLHYHNQSGSLVTLSVKDIHAPRRFLFNDDSVLCGWENASTKEKIISRSGESPLTKLSFCGIHVISPAIFDLIGERGMFSIVELYLRLAKTHIIRAYRQDNALWIDVGDSKSLAQAADILNEIEKQ